jgi:uncharacterized phage-like protein YoqJ
VGKGKKLCTLLQKKLNDSYTKIETSLITQNDSFGKNWKAKNLGKFLRILRTVIEKSFIS